MEANDHPLGRLIGPLQYACEDNFAKLPQVRGLRQLVEGAFASATQQGVVRGTGPLLQRHIDAIDAPSLEVRKKALCEILNRLRRSGVELPEPLAQMVPASNRLPPARSRIAPGARKPLSAEGPRATKNGAGLDLEGTRKPDARAEARLLSIAPRSGPLAAPLRNAGWRLNPRLIGALNRRGLRKLGDVLFLLPRCYEDRRRISDVARLVPGTRGVTVAIVRAIQESPRRYRRGGVFRAVLGDGSGTIAATYFQTGPWLKARFPIGKRLLISGEVRASSFGREIAHPEVEPAEDLESSSIHFNRIVPIYPGFERHEQRALRELAFRVRDEFAKFLDDPLPDGLRTRLGLLPLQRALRDIHFPAEDADLAAFNDHQSACHRRLAFDEFFFLQLGMLLKRQGVKSRQGIAFNVGPDRLERIRSRLAFPLTGAQSRVIQEISKDMSKPEPMNRLLQGDVGSGKTAVAMICASLALQDGYQVAVMAPTEILADQLYRTFGKTLTPLGFDVQLVTAGGTAKQKRDVRHAVGSGSCHVAVGTHALIQESVDFHRLGLVIIDEQHRFGVIQRHALMSKGPHPDVLVMTATPIPRTLAMTLYGDLDLSVIDEMPPGRTAPVTKVFTEKQRSNAYQAIERELSAGRQCYVVYPLVEESEKVDLADATRGATKLQEEFPRRRVGLLHGRLSTEDKNRVMKEFRDKALDILVCTTVVEVGVDIPNASIMVIEAAERFGLSQLHQLRGRVGRGAAASYCFLIAGYARSREASDRLGVMESSSDGFVIAQKDLDLRGPGEFLGTRQSGIPELAVADLGRDAALLSLAREEAMAVVARDPALRTPENQGLVKALEERWEGRLALARVG